MNGTPDPQRAILILGDDDAADMTLTQAARYGEVFVLARAVPTGDSRYLVDEGLAEARALRRLRRAAGRLRARGVRTTGFVGDADRQTARRDAIALFPRSSLLLEAA